jgi:hypothetical protein
LRRTLDGQANPFTGDAGQISGRYRTEIHMLTFLDAVDARTIVVIGLILPILVTLLLFFFARGFFRRFWILILLLAGALEWFLIVQVGPLFL